MLYTVITLNGRFFEFYADEMKEIDDTWFFYIEDECVGEFKKDALTGYFITHVEEEEE